MRSCNCQPSGAILSGRQHCCFYFLSISSRSHSFGSSRSAAPSNLEKPHYGYFNFNPHSLRLISCATLDSVCSGTYCDSHTGTSSCACLLSDSHKYWCLRLTMTCDEFQEMAQEVVDFVSTQTTTDFVAHESSTQGCAL